MRIRRRLALYGAFVIGAAMLVFSVLLNLLATQGAPRDQEDSLAQLARQTREVLSGFTAAALAESAPLVYLDLESSLDPFVAAYAEDGSPMYTTGQVGGAAPRLPAAVLVEALETGESNAPIFPAPGTELRVAAVRSALSDGTPIVVIAGESAEFVEEQLAGLRVVIWAAAIITLVAATVASWLVSGRALRPLRDLVATTDEIRKTGDLGQRLPRVKADDEVGRLADSFNAMLETVEASQSGLSDALQAQRRFVADASHELRGPLTTIRANAGFLRDRRDVTDDDRADAVGDISTRADRMARLVDDLLILASADGGVRAARSIVDLAAVLSDVEHAMERTHRDVVVVGVGNAHVLGDANALARLIWILFENAVTHGADPVAATIDRHGESVRLRVSDEGPGFPADDLDRVFERFYRADPARSPAGSGLGLAIAYDIVEAHSGTIEAANRSEGGAEVTVTFPAA